MEKYDVLVVGLGAMGSASAYQLAKHGVRVLGIDRFSPPHAFGSSHGETRITRLAIGEGVHYTPFVVRSHRLWREIERETGTDLLTVTGGLVISSAARTANLHVGTFFANTVAAAQQHNIAHEILTAAEIRRRFPAFHVHDDEQGYYEIGAGFLRPEACVRAQLSLAAKYGAELHTEETMLSFDARANEAIVTTDKSSYACAKLVLTAGAWLPQILGRTCAAEFHVFRQVLYWFDINGSVTPFLPQNFPIFIWELQGPQQAIYGFPAIDGQNGGVKVATQQYERTTTPNEVERAVSPTEIATMHANYVAPYLPGLSAACIKAVSCLYTVTPDAGFVIDTHPNSDRVIVASPCSGHGFKHSAAIGEAIAEWVCDGQSRLDLSPFTLDRFSRPTK